MEKNRPDEPAGDFVRRPPGQLHNFPIEIRWEVTRRHPYYLAFWEEVQRYRQDRPDDTSERKLFGFAATLALGAIGVTGMPVSPSTPFAELIGPDSDPAFLSGTVQPMTFRNLTAMMLTALPAAERAFVGSLLLTSGSEEYRGDENLKDQRLSEALDRLSKAPSAALDSVPMTPLFFVHLGASQRSIVRDLEDQVRRWKAKKGDESSKIHTAKLQDYLDVWDLREGWTGCGYDRSRESRLLAIAKNRKTSLSTIASRYRSAFELIVGHEFKPELWWRVFGPLKFSRIFGDSASHLSEGVRRHLRTPLPRQVPDSVVSGESDSARSNSTVEKGTAVGGDGAVRELILDLDELIGKDLSDTEIADRMDLDPETVGYYRRHDGELRSLLK